MPAAMIVKTGRATERTADKEDSGRLEWRGMPD